MIFFGFGAFIFAGPPPRRRFRGGRQVGGKRELLDWHPRAGRWRQTRQEEEAGDGGHVQSQNLPRGTQDQHQAAQVERGLEVRTMKRGTAISFEKKKVLRSPLRI